MTNRILMERYFHILMLMPMCVAASSIAASDLDLRFCTNSVNGVSQGSFMPDIWYGGALKIDESTADAFKGCKVDAVNFTLGSTSAKDVEVFITRGLKETPIWSATVSPQSPGSPQSVKVDEAFEIDGAFFVGYKLKEPSGFCSPLSFDFQKGSPFYHNSYYAIASSATSLGEKWTESNDAMGNISIGCSISGNIPASYAVPLGVGFAQYQKPDVPFNVSLPLINLGKDDAASFDVDITIDGIPYKSYRLTPAAAVASGEFLSMNFDVAIDGEAVEQELGFSISKTNELGNSAATFAAVGPIICSNDLFPRAFVVEDFTGSTCGYCPIGYVAMDKLTEYFKDSDTRFIPIAIHNYGRSAVHCNDYEDFINYYGFASAPSSIVNREEKVQPTYNNLLALWDGMAQESVGNVQLKAWFADFEKSEVAVEAITSFARDYPDSEFSLSFVLTEDQLGPYMQDNYYNDNPSVPEFYQKGDKVMMLYDHVARTVVGWNGLDESVPSVIKGEEYSYSTTISLDNCLNTEFTRLICLLLRNSDGVVVNAEYVNLSDITTDGIEELNMNVSMSTRHNELILTGYEGSVNVFDSTGVNVASVEALKETTTINLNSGFYIVQTASKTFKVLIP